MAVAGCWKLKMVRSGPRAALGVGAAYTTPCGVWYMMIWLGVTAPVPEPADQHSHSTQTTKEMFEKKALYIEVLTGKCYTLKTVPASLLTKCSKHEAMACQHFEQNILSLTLPNAISNTDIIKSKLDTNMRRRTFLSIQTTTGLVWGLFQKMNRSLLPVTEVLLQTLIVLKVNKVQRPEK